MDSLPATCFTPCRVSRRVIYTSCPKYQKSVVFFSCCLCVGKCRSKPGKVSFDFGRTHKCKKIESALHWVWTTIFGRNRAVYLGWEAKMSTTSEWNYRRIFIICKVEFCQGTNSEPQPLPLMPRCLYLITNTHFGFVFISHWYYTEEQWLSICSGAGQPAAAWRTPSPFLPKHTGARDIVEGADG